MRVLFLNQYFPPDPAPTGVLMREVAMAVAGAGHKVAFASSGQAYRGGRKGGSRLRREIAGLWALFRAAMAVGPVDVVVSGTSPPLLAVVAGWVARMRGARHYHWLFDMYPELAVALGEISDGAMARLFASAARRAYRRADCVVALDEDMAALLKAKGVTPRIIPPWVTECLIEALVAGKAGQPREPEQIWVYSGNLGRAHEWRTLLDAQRIIETSGGPWRLVFQGGGPAWQPAQEYARQIGLARCDWRPYVPEDQLPGSLLAADVLIVTQKPETCGLLWPSKLALLTSLPRPILWVGPTDRAIARDLAAAPQAGIFGPGDVAGVAGWLGEVRGKTVSGVRDAAGVRAAGLREWVGIIEAGEK
jgi:colanic acid biosynthesis glycosyl transferase WcaI